MTELTPVANSRVSILYIVPPSRQFAGIERVVHEIAEGLVHNFGEYCDVHVLYFSKYGEIEDVDPHYIVHVIEVDRLRGLFVPLRKFFKNHTFDLVIPCQIETSTLCWFALGSNNKAIFIPYLHGNPRIEEKISFTNRIVFWIYRSFVAARVDSVFAVSESLAAYVRGSMSAGRRVHYVRNPARTLGHLTENRVRKQFSFVCVARLHRQKGLDILLDAFARVLVALPDAELVLVGDGPERASLEQFARNLGVGERVTFAGYTDPTPFLETASCFVLASRWEGFPLVLVEALSFGLPLVVTDCDFGCRDLVTDPRIGRVCKTESVGALAKAMIEVALTDLGAEVAEFRRNKAKEFGISRVVEEHFYILCDIIKNKEQTNEAHEPAYSRINHVYKEL